jgi:hypothetical protein
MSDGSDTQWREDARPRPSYSIASRFASKLNAQILCDKHRIWPYIFHSIQWESYDSYIEREEKIGDGQRFMDFPRGDALGKFHQWALFTERELTTLRKSYLDHSEKPVSNIFASFWGRFTKLEQL